MDRHWAQPSWRWRHDDRRFSPAPRRANRTAPRCVACGYDICGDARDRWRSVVEHARRSRVLGDVAAPLLQPAVRGSERLSVLAGVHAGAMAVHAPSLAGVLRVVDGWTRCVSYVAG